MTASLPHFADPPLDEVVIGVQFQAPKKFGAPHLGLFWSRIRDRYPSAEDQPPLAPHIEPAELLQAAPQGVKLMLRQAVVPRCWFLDPSKNRLIQLQPDRFLRNWRRVKGDESYPRFAVLFDEFNHDLAEFRRFLNEEGLGEMAITQCELTYINNIEQGMGWNTFADLGNVFPMLSTETAKGFLPESELTSWEAKYKLPGKSGRLHVEMNPALRGRDLKLILAMTLSARGNPVADSAEHLTAWFEQAHEWIVRGFHELTSSSMHELWKEQS